MRMVDAGMVRPSPSDVGAPMGAEPVGDYQRKTQSPIIWLSNFYFFLNFWLNEIS